MKKNKRMWFVSEDKAANYAIYFSLPVTIAGIATSIIYGDAIAMWILEPFIT